MDRQSAISMQGNGANSGAAVQEWLYPGGLQPEQAIVNAFLVELLEDAPVVDQPPEDVDYLSHVIRSLDAEISSGGGPPPSAVADGGGTPDHLLGEVYNGGLEDYLLPDLDSNPGPCVAEAPLELWMEAPLNVGHDMVGWYVDDNGVTAGYEFREQCYYGYSDSPHVEQVYSPLWE